MTIDMLKEYFIMGNNYEKRYLDYSDAYSIRKELGRYGNSINNGYADALIGVKAALNSMFGVGADYSTYQIKNVIFNNPATIVFWNDNTKTVVKCGPYDHYDPEKGLAMAFCKKAMGNHGNYYNVFKKWLPEEYTSTEDDTPSQTVNNFKSKTQTFTFELKPSCVRVTDALGNMFDMLSGCQVTKVEFNDLTTDKAITEEDKDHE